jgi:hypothetical protein
MVWLKTHTWIFCSPQDGVVRCAIRAKPRDAMIDKVPRSWAAILTKHCSRIFKIFKQQGVNEVL